MFLISPLSYLCTVASLTPNASAISNKVKPNSDRLFLFFPVQ
jgi:hypothetical protein